MFLTSGLESGDAVKGIRVNSAEAVSVDELIKRRREIFITFRFFESSKLAATGVV
jgi:hypothetical protein